MKDITKRLQKKLCLNDEKQSLLKSLSKQILISAIGFFASVFEILPNMRPLGVALIFSVPGEYSIFCFFGVILGYIAGGDRIVSIMYLASSAAAAAIKLTVSKLLDKKQVGIWSLLATALLLFLTSAVTKGNSISGISVSLFEATVGGVAAISIYSILTAKPYEKHKNSALALGIILLCGFMRISFLGISFGLILSVTAVCISSEYGKSGASAAIGGICGGIAFLSGENMFAPLILTLSAVAAGLASRLGKVAVSSAALIAAITTVTILKFPQDSLPLLISFLLGIFFYLLMPGSISAKLSCYLRSSDFEDSTFGIKRNLEMRLSFTADALRKINKITTEASERLAAADSPLFDRVLAGTKKEACEGCGFSGICWKQDFGETERTVREIARSYHNRNPLSIAEVSSSFSTRCPRKERVENAVVRFYSRFIDESRDDSAARKARLAVYDQIDAMGNLLEHTLEDISKPIKYDADLTNAVSDMLASLSLNIRHCSVSYGEEGRVSIEFTLPAEPEPTLNRSKIRSSVSSIVGKKLSIPEIVKADRVYLVSLCEQPMFCLDYGTFGIRSDGSKISGDKVGFINDGRGKSFLILSDGMGTGSRAAVDSAMTVGLASKLISADFGMDYSLKMINTSLMYHSGEESLATLDIVSFDLYTGECAFYKAGAAESVILKNRRTSTIDCRSLPLGILRNVGFEKSHSKLSVGDGLLLMSDGVTVDGTDWICKEFESFEGSAESFAEHIARQAKRRRSGERADDITVACLIVGKQF